MFKYFTALFILIFCVDNSASVHAEASIFTKESLLHNLQKVPTEDKKELERFFRYLMQSTSFGYVLLGEKPLSIEDYSLRPNLRGNSKEAAFLTPGWKIWLKYQDLFPTREFIFSLSQPRFSENEILTLYLGNKKSLKKTIKDNQEFFKTVGVFDENLEIFVEKVLSIDTESFLKYRYEVLGIVLGYGLENARSFQKQVGKEYRLFYLQQPPQKIAEAILKLPIQEKILLSVNQQTSSSSISVSQKEQLEALDTTHYSLKNLIFSCELEEGNNPLSPVELPPFRVFDEEKSRALLLEYHRTRVKLCKLLQEKEFLKRFLMHFCLIENNPPSEN